MARKKTVDNPPKPRRKRAAKKKTTRKRTAEIKTAVQVAQADTESVEPHDNDQSAVETPPGIICPKCGCRDLRAPDGRPWEITHTERKFGFIRRRRVCRYCGKVVITHEQTENRS